MQVKRIECPKCKVVLDVKQVNEQLERRFLCPRCRAELLVKFSPNPAPIEAPTFCAKPRPTSEKASCETQLFSAPPKQEKDVRLTFNGKSYKLSEGRNIVGRSAQSSQADIQIDVDDMYMSRHHCIINVSTLPDNSKKVVLNNYKNKNVTAVNGQQLLEDDVIRLADGNIITMGKTNIKVVM